MLQVHQDRAGLAAPIVARIYEGRVARIHRDGDPLTYPNLKGSQRQQYRDAAGLAEICQELKQGRPYTLHHPADLISKGTPADIVGRVIGARIDGDYVVAQILITDPRAEQALKDGISELSLGYTSHVDTNGRQSLIKVDHLAQVPRARCGSSCALRRDCADDEPCACTNHAIGYTTGIVAEQLPPDAVLAGAIPAPESVQGIPRITMDEMQKKLAELAAEAATQAARANQLDAALATTKAALTAAEIEATNAKAALATEKQLTADALASAAQSKADATAAVVQAKLDSDSALTGAVNARVKLLTEVNTILGDKDAKGEVIDRSTMDEQTLHRAVILHVDALEFPADKDPVFLAGVYAGSLARADKAVASRAGVRAAAAKVVVINKDAAQAAKNAPSTLTAEALERTAMINSNKPRARI